VYLLVSTGSTFSQNILFSADTPSQYVQGFDGNISFSVLDQPASSDILVLAWSDSQMQMVQAFAHTVTGGPFEIDASKLSLLPAGRVNLQLLLRVAGKTIVQASQWIEVFSQPTVTFAANAATEYVQGVSAPIEFNVEGAMPAGWDVLALAWSDGEQQMVADFAHTQTAPWLIDADHLNLLPQGSNDVQLLLRGTRNGKMVTVAKASHQLQVMTGATLAFAADAPAQYAQGTGQAIGFVVNGTLAAGSEVVASAWSEAQGAEVAEFTHAVAASPWVIDPAKLDGLPEGRVKLQLALKQAGAATAGAVEAEHWVDVMPARAVRFPSDAPTIYVQGTNSHISFLVSGAMATDDDVMVLAWSDGEMRMVDAFAHRVTGQPWQIDAAKLDDLPAGRVNLQLMLRINKQIISQDDHWLDVRANSTTPGGDPPPVEPPPSGGPTVSQLDGLSNGQIVSGELAVRAVIANGIPDRVQFVLFRESVKVGEYTASSEPYDFPGPGGTEGEIWDTRSLPNGSYTLFVDVYPNASNETSDELPIRFEINNQTESDLPDDLGDLDPVEYGWSGLKASADTRMIYVSSSSGNDSNTGLSPNGAVRTASRGYALLRNGHPDWLLFKAGDTFTGGVSGGSAWDKSGSSAAEPMVVGAYGSGPRPKFKTNGGSFINVSQNTLLQHVAFVGIHMYANRRDPGSPDFDGGRQHETGVRWLTPFNNLMFEDCLIEYFAFGMTFQPANASNTTKGYYPQKNLLIKRCIIRNSYSPYDVGNSAGIFIMQNENARIYASVFDHNGWEDRVARASKTVFNHSAYIHLCKDFSFVGNISARAANLGLKIRSDLTGGFDGAKIRYNLFIGNTNAMSIGGNEDKATGSYQAYSTKNVVLQNNVFTRMGGVLNDAPQSLGAIMNTVENAVAEGNIFLDKPSSGTSCSVKCESWLPQRNVLIRSNVVHNWDRGIMSSSGGGITAVDNLVDQSPTRYVDASRTLMTYQKKLGGLASVEAFLAEAGKQSRSNWRPAYTAVGAGRYFQAGFKVRN
jgi:hypothetical protein